MKVKLIETNNPVLEKLKNKEMHLFYSMFFIVKYDTEGLENYKGEFKSATIENIKIEDIGLFEYKITIKTIKYNYVFFRGRSSKIDDSGLETFMNTNLL